MSRVRDLQKAQAERFRSMLKKLDRMPATNIDLKDEVRARIIRALAAVNGGPPPTSLET
jgi:hypothetical protein